MGKSLPYTKPNLEAITSRFSVRHFTDTDVLVGLTMAIRRYERTGYNIDRNLVFKKWLLKSFKKLPQPVNADALIEQFEKLLNPKNDDILDILWEVAWYMPLKGPLKNSKFAGRLINFLRIAFPTDFQLDIDRIQQLLANSGHKLSKKVLRLWLLELHKMGLLTTSGGGQWRVIC
jgi:hypothetical protein